MDNSTVLLPQPRDLLLPERTAKNQNEIKTLMTTTTTIEKREEIIGREVVVTKEVVANGREEEEIIVMAKKKKIFIRRLVVVRLEEAVKVVDMISQAKVTDRQADEVKDGNNNAHHPLVKLPIVLITVKMIVITIIVAPRKRNVVVLHRRRKSVEENLLAGMYLVVVIIITILRETSNNKTMHLSSPKLMIVMVRDHQQSTMSISVIPKKMAIIPIPITTTEPPPKSRLQRKQPR